MLKQFRAVPVGEDPARPDLAIMAASDLDAFLQAKQALGDATHFDLWEDSRRALAYRPPSAAPRSANNPMA